MRSQLPASGAHRVATYASESARGPGSVWETPEAGPGAEGVGAPVAWTGPGSGMGAGGASMGTWAAGRRARTVTTPVAPRQCAAARRPPWVGRTRGPPRSGRRYLDRSL